MSYDDQPTLKEFAEKQEIPYPLLSDIDSEVIRDYQILNTEVSRDDAMLFGIPFPGVFVTDESGRITAKFFHDTYKKRDSPETLIDAALGQVTLDEDTLQFKRGDTDIKITAAIRGGKGSIRQGVIRHLVVRFELAQGLHIYGEPVPEGMVATQISVKGPPGLTAMDPILPPTKKLHVAGADLEVWSGTVDLVVPFYAKGELASETRPLDMSEAPIEVKIRYQACTDDECLLPKTETLSFSLPLDVIDVPALSLHMGHGQREGSYSSMPAMLRLISRKARAYPPGLFKYIYKTMKLSLAARKRAKQNAEL